MALQITRIKPNPTGKDRSRYGQTSAAQLAAEWVDFQNNGSAAVDLAPVELWHRAYHHGQNPTWEKVMTFSGKLQPGKTVRVHSGSGPEASSGTRTDAAPSIIFSPEGTTFGTTKKATRQRCSIGSRK